jgi:spermidine/putrescine transport system ATP-binding protein
MQFELKRIQAEVGITFIYVTHDQEEAMTMSNRIAVMNHGRYEQLGTPEELYERPATRFVAGFLGASNLLPGRVESAGSPYAVVRLRDGSAVRVPRALLGDRRVVDVGVRPEKIRLEDATASEEAAGPDAVNSLTGSVSSSAYTGVSTQYRVALADGHEVEVYEQNLERALGTTLRQGGQRVRLLWSPDDTFVVAPREAADETEPETAPGDLLAPAGAGTA